MRQPIVQAIHTSKRTLISPEVKTHCQRLKRSALLCFGEREEGGLQECCAGTSGWHVAQLFHLDAESQIQNNTKFYICLGYCSDHCWGLSQAWLASGRAPSSAEHPCPLQPRPCSIHGMKSRKCDRSCGSSGRQSGVELLCSVYMGLRPCLCCCPAPMRTLEPGRVSEMLHMRVYMNMCMFSGVALNGESSGVRAW